jgi:hypothetical protein
MGFTKWLFKNGFGSIGSTAKTFTQMYIDTVSDISEEDSKEGAFLHVIISYAIANRQIRQYNCTDPTLLLDKSEGCLAMLMWILICDIPSNLKAILLDEKGFDTSVEVIYQCVMEKAPNEILMTPSIFKTRAFEYLDYRDNESRALQANNNIKELKYKTICIHKPSMDVEKKEDISYEDAKKRFDNLTDYKSSEEFLVWTAEMNSDKYVFVHLCNNQLYKDNFNSSCKKLNGKVRIKNVDYYEY